jgi:hypothetical protein
MSGQDISPSRSVVAVDPPGCGCTECLTGEYVPLQCATHAQVADLVTGTVGNNTGLTFTIAPGQDPATVHVIPVFAEDGVPVAGNAPDEPEWHMVEPGWNMDIRLFAGSSPDPDRAAPALPPLQPATIARIRSGLARHAAPPAGEVAESGGCACPGRAEGRHDFVCEHALRGAYGSVGDAPEDVKQLLRARHRLVTGTVVVPDEPGAGPADGPAAVSFPEAHAPGGTAPGAGGQRRPSSAPGRSRAGRAGPGSGSRPGLSSPGGHGDR